MSVLRVITRIIPLTSSEPSFEPVPFNALTDGISKEIKVLNLTEPKSGINYRIERIEDIYNVGPGETVEDVNAAFAEKLKNIPGFVQLKATDTQVNPFQESFQFHLPQVLSINGDELSEANSNSLTVSVVKNSNSKKNSILKKSKYSGALDKNEKDEIHNGIKSSKSKHITINKKCKIKLGSKIKIVSGHFSKFQNNQKLKSDKLNGIDQTTNSQNDCDVIAGINVKQASNMKSPGQGFVENHENHNSTDKVQIKKRDIEVIANDKQKNSSLDDSLLDLEGGELIISVPEDTDSCSNSHTLYDVLNDKCDKSHSLMTNHNGSTLNTAKDTSAASTSSADDSFASNPTDSFQMSDSDSSEIASNHVSNSFPGPKVRPLCDLLQRLKKYFVNGECLICGFIPAEKNYNTSVHMETHISQNPSPSSYYKCHCCDEAFDNVRRLYLHSLARVKAKKYMCDICFLKFKRKHYLICHKVKAHTDV